MAGEYEIDAGGNRGSLLTVILGNVLWTLKLQELVNQGVLWNVFASVFSRLSELICHFKLRSECHGPWSSATPTWSRRFIGICPAFINCFELISTINIPCC